MGLLFRREEVAAYPASFYSALRITFIIPETVITLPLDITALDFVMSEYRTRTEQSDRSYRLVIQIAGIAFATYGAIVGYVLTRNPDSEIDTIAYWLLPLTFIIPYSICIQLFFRMIMLDYYLRDLERIITRETGLSIVHFQWAQTRAFWSIRTGSKSFIASYAIIFAIAVGLYVALVVFSYEGIRQTSGGPAIWYFTAIQVLVSVSMVAILWASQTQVRSRYERWMWLEHEYEYPPGGGALAVYAIVPRPFDLLVKSSTITIPAAAIFAWLTHAEVRSQTIAEVVISIIVIDFLVKQTTYVWNDASDLARDTLHPHKKRRPLARFGDLILGKRIFYARSLVTLTLTIVAAIALRAPWVLAVAAGAVAFQAFYQAWRSTTYMRLSAVSGGYSIRVLAAAIPLMTNATSNLDILALLILWTVSFAFVFMSEYLRVDTTFADQETAPAFRRLRVNVGRPANLFLLPLTVVLLVLGDRLDSSNQLEVAVGVLLSAGFMLAAHRFITARSRPFFMVGLATLAVSTWLLGWEAAVLVAAFPLAICIIYTNATFAELNLLWLGETFRGVAGFVDAFFFPVTPPAP